MTDKPEFISGSICCTFLIDGRWFTLDVPITEPRAEAVQEAWVKVLVQVREEAS